MYRLNSFPTLTNLLSDDYSNEYQITKDDEKYVFSMSLPGLSKEDISVLIEDDLLVITINKENNWVKFKRRKFIINSGIELVEANMKNGILSILFNDSKKYKKNIQIH